MIRALVTRPAEDAAPLVKALEARGVSVLVEPLLTIRPKEGAAVDLEGVQALLFTSANGVRAFAKASAARDLPALAVGDGTAEALRALAFTRVDSAGGEVEDLERLARLRLDPAKGRLLHVAGITVAGDLAGRLGAAGFVVERMALYEAEPATQLSPAASRAIEAGTVDWVLVFSPRTASTFASLVGRAGLAEPIRKITLVALSEAVAKAAALPFGRVVVAAKPNQAALLETVDGLIRDQAMTETTSAAAAAPAKRRSALPLIIAAVAVASLIVAAALVASWPSLETPTPAARVDLTPLSRTVDRLEAAVAEIGQRLDGVAEEAKKATTEAARAAEAAAARPSDGTPAPAASPPDLGPIESRLATVERTLADLGRRAEAIAGLERRLAPLAEIERRIATLDDSERRLAEVEQRIATLGDSERRLAEVERRIATLGESERRLAEVERLTKVERRHDVAALAALRLGDALAAGRPYKDELALLAGNAALEAEMRALTPRAEAGVPTRAMLIERFAAAAATAARAGGDPGDVWDRALSRLKGLITIRRLTPGDDVDGRLARAELALRDGDLAEALAATEALPEGEAKALAGWRADAAARLEVDGAFERLTRALAADLGRPG